MHRHARAQAPRDRWVPPGSGRGRAPDPITPAGFTDSTSLRPPRAGTPTSHRRPRTAQPRCVGRSCAPPPGPRGASKVRGRRVQSEAEQGHLTGPPVAAGIVTAPAAPTLDRAVRQQNRRSVGYLSRRHFRAPHFGPGIGRGTAEHTELSADRDIDCGLTMGCLHWGKPPRSGATRAIGSSQPTPAPARSKGRPPVQLRVPASPSLGRRAGPRSGTAFEPTAARCGSVGQSWSAGKDAANSRSAAM